MSTPPVYATRRAVKDATDVAETARANTRIDDALQTASRYADALCHRRFYPEVRTLTFDWPTDDRYLPWVLYLNDHELVSLATLASGGTAISGALLRPDWGPPYSRIELDRSLSPAGWSAGATPQRSISVAGVFGYDLNEAAAGTLAAAPNSSTTTLTVSDASTIGPGSLLRIGTERVVCTDAAMATTGLTITGNPTASNADTSLAVSGAGLHVGEIILIDAERMLIVDMVGNNPVVRRAVDGSTLGAHTAGATIYALRALTVDRGAVGTTAAAHNSGDTIYRHVFPGALTSYAVSHALVDLGMQQAGGQHVTYRAGSKETLSQFDLDVAENRLYATLGRKNRTRAV